MKRLFGVIWIVLALGLSACNSATSDKDEEAIRAATTPEAKPRIIIPAGTQFSVVPKDGVSTSSSTAGSEFSASLASPIVVDGKTVLEMGLPVTGRGVDVEKSGRVKGRASLSLVVTSVVHNGKSAPVETRTYVGIARSTKNVTPVWSAEPPASARLSAVREGQGLFWQPAVTKCTIPGNPA